MKPAWSDRLLPILQSRKSAAAIEFVMGAVAAAGLLGFTMLVLWLQQKGAGL